jgi:hypothetical protein
MGGTMRWNKVMRKINRALVGVSMPVVGNIVTVLNGNFLSGDGNGIINVDIIFLAGLCLLISCVAWVWTFKRHHFYYVVAGLFLTMMIMWSTFMNFYWVTNGWSYYIFGVALMGTLIVAMNKSEFN